MKRLAILGLTVAVVSTLVLGSPFVRVAAAQEAPSQGRFGERWLSRIDPWHGIPAELALRFGEAALTAGLTSSEAVRLLNDERFVGAVGAPDQGWGLLEALVEEPDRISDAWSLLKVHGDELTRSGVTSFQFRFMTEHPELRNPYLADLGHTIAVRPDGVEVLVDIETGRQITGRDRQGAERLGIPITAPGGGPLPEPALSPEEVAAQMWAEAGIDPDASEASEPAVGARAQEGPTGPGFNFRMDEEPAGLFTPFVWVVLGGLALSWLGYAIVMIVRRFRAS